MRSPAGNRHGALVLCVLLGACRGISQPASSPVVFVLADGSQLTGSVLSESPDQVVMNTKSFRAFGAPPVTVVLDAVTILSCSMIDPGVNPITISGHLCAAAAPPVVFVLADGSQLTGTVLSQSPGQVVIDTKSLRASGSPPVPVVLDPVSVVSCSMIDPGVNPTRISSHLCAAAVPPIHSGLQQASLSLGYVGSAQRDESVKSTVTFAGFQGLKSTGSFRGKTYLNLNVAYDDKWKDKPLSSNVTQVYEGLLTQSIFSRPTPDSKCSSNDYPFAYQFTGHAYHNNGQGIDVDQSYGYGISRSFVLGQSTGSPSLGCSRASSPYSQRVELSADIRSVNYFLYPPGNTVHGVGTQFQFGYSRTFPSKQVVALTVGGVPVYNNSSMSQASGIFEYLIPFKSSWAVQFSVTDNYYEIAPKTFNKNYVNVGLGIKFTPPKAVLSK